MSAKATVLLVAPFPTGERRLREDPPMGLAYIASALEMGSHDVRIFDMAVEDRFSPMQVIQRLQASIVGVQVLTQHRLFVFDLTRQIKRSCPDTTVVLGGPHVTFTADEVLRQVPTVDVVVRGEGENAMRELADGAALADIDGISYRRKGKVVHNPARSPADLNELPMPAYHLLNLKRYNLRVGGQPALPVFTSRGCPQRCIFCSAGHMWGRPRFYDPERVIEHLETLRQRFAYSAFVIEDDTFGADRRVAEEILKGIRELRVSFAVKSRANLLTKEFLRSLKEAGCAEVKFGVESGEPRVLRAIKKGINLRQVIGAVESAKRLGIKVGVYFMAGNLTETRDDVIASVTLARRLAKLGAHPIWAWGVLVFPGTELEHRARDAALLPKDFSWCEPFCETRNALLGYSPHTPVLENGHLSIESLAELRDERQRIMDGTVLHVVKSIGRRVLPQTIRELNITHRAYETLAALLK